MAGILATMVVGPLVSMVKEKASSYLLEQYKVMEGMEEQHEVLKRKLPAILDVIADAEMQAARHREGAKAWLEAVRKVAYQANDVFDEFKYEALRRKAKKEGHYRKLGMDVIKLFPTHNRIVFRYRMGNKLRLVLQEMEVLIAEMNAFRFKFKPQQQLSMKWRQTDPNIVDAMVREIASTSREEDKQKVVGTLLGQRSNVDLTVLPIVGMGGMGKTTLAQLVYNDSKIREHFQLLLWVCVSDNFDVDLLAKRIVVEATKEEKNGIRPLDRLREVLSGKRYLLVLDDVWNRDASQWEKLKSSLQHGGIGSSVLTTTRDETIAQFMDTTKAYHKLGLLDQSFIEKIIKTKAFGSEESPDNELGGMVGDMAKKCAGSPLAATALGSVLRTKTSVEEWKAVLSRSTICDEETGILPILKLSYNDLPSQMRQCFAFCALFPKDYEIEVDMLIQLWMANGFILEEQGLCPEISGKQIFKELASRSFFQIPSEHNLLKFSQYEDCSRITCKIHDLMHDVAQSAMGKECATIAIKPSKREDFPYSSRHLFVQLDHPGIILNGFLEERSPALQTLLCTEYEDKELQYLSKNNSIRALRILGGSSLFLKPKYLHHLRYLDLSESRIKALPEDISILYHLQTLNLSDCQYLAQLPKLMKYMTALRHLYTHGCEELKMMPPELGCLTSLQTLTCFVAGTTGSSCSNLGELKMLDLGGQLEVCQLENVTEKDARAANLENKKRLTELTLKWTDRNRESQHDHKVLDCLKPHDGIKSLRIDSYGGSTYPAWMNTLQDVVELFLFDCNEVQKLPPLWRLPALQFLDIYGMKNLQCLCGGDPPFTFEKLKSLHLDCMPNFETWWDINAVHGQKDPIFPEVERLSIGNCEKLTALPRASAITETSSGVVNTVWRSACPALKELELYDLATFERWEAAEGTLGEQQVTTFPRLEELLIKRCPQLTTLPEAPKLKVLDVEGSRQQIFLHAARYITSLSTLRLSFDQIEATDHSLIELVDDKEKWNRESSALREIYLTGCDFLFPQSSAAALWNCFVQLEDLIIWNCDALVHWPENVFRRLVSLRKLWIIYCKNLTGATQQASEQPTPPEQSVLPPRLESLRLWNCESLVEVPTLPASLRVLFIHACDKLESVILRKQQKDTSTRLGSGDGVLIRQEKSSTAVQNLSSSNIPCPDSPRLEATFYNCRNLQSLSVQLDCNALSIQGCSMLKSLDGDLPSLERLALFDCKSLESIPDGPQAYSSLRYLEIRYCPRLKVLPPCLKQQLNDIEKKFLDARYTEPAWKRMMGRHC